jgi:hypothetical protein
MEEAELAATLRRFVADSGVAHVVAATGGATYGCDAAGSVTRQAGPDAAPVVLGPDEAAGVALDVERGEREELEDAARAALALARALAPGAEVVVWVAGEDDLETAVSARHDGGVTVVLGDEEIEMEEGWPPPAGGGQAPGERA